MTKDIAKILAEEGDAIERAEEHDETYRNLQDVKITRGHDRSRTLQMRLNDEEYEQLEAFANGHGLPVSTAARALLLEVLLQPPVTPELAIEQIEVSVAALRRQLPVLPKMSDVTVKSSSGSSASKKKARA